MEEQIRSSPAGSDRNHSAACSHQDCAGLSLAHDFRNMLQLATSTARIVQRELINRSDRRLALMLGDALHALDKANLLAQRLSAPNSRAGEIGEILFQHLLPEFRTLLSRTLPSNIQFESLVAEHLPPLRCDPLHLENVLLNLALNACQAMPLGGTVVLQAVHCLRSGHRDCIALSVTDTGSGMTQEVAAKAFDPFYSTRLTQGGTGLGLFNVQAFAKSLNGGVELSTTEGAGTQVLLHLPIAPVRDRS